MTLVRLFGSVSHYAWVIFFSVVLLLSGKVSPSYPARFWCFQNFGKVRLLVISFSSNFVRSLTIEEASILTILFSFVSAEVTYTRPGLTYTRLSVAFCPPLLILLALSLFKNGSTHTHKKEISTQKGICSTAFHKQ